MSQFKCLPGSDSNAFGGEKTARRRAVREVHLVRQLVAAIGEPMQDGQPNQVKNVCRDTNKSSGS